MLCVYSWLARTLEWHCLAVAAVPCLHRCSVAHSLPSSRSVSLHSDRIPSAGNIKATTPIAFTTTLLVWGLMAFGKGFEASRVQCGVGGSCATLSAVAPFVYFLTAKLHCSLIACMPAGAPCC